MRIRGLFGSASDAPDDEALDREPCLPVLRDLSADGYCGFTGALSQARDMVAMHQRRATDPNLTDDERTWAARTAVNQQAAIQPFAALIGDRTELDALHALDDQAADTDDVPGSWSWTP